MSSTKSTSEDTFHLSGYWKEVSLFCIFPNKRANDESYNRQFFWYLLLNLNHFINNAIGHKRSCLVDVKLTDVTVFSVVTDPKFFWSIHEVVFFSRGDGCRSQWLPSCITYQITTLVFIVWYHNAVAKIRFLQLWSVSTRKVATLTNLYKCTTSCGNLG